MLAKSQSASRVDRFQKALEEFHNLNNELGIMGERLRYAERIRMLDILDNYISGQLSIIFEVEPSLKIDNVGRPLEMMESRTPPRLAVLIYHRNARNIDASQNGDKQPMFVGVVQNVYGPDGVIPSAIRTYLVEEETREFGAEVANCGLFAGLFEPTFKLLVGLTNGEFGAGLTKSRKRLFNRLEPCIVQSAVKIVDNISQYKGDFIESRRVCELMYKAFGSELRVNLNPGSIGFLKRENACFDVCDMLIGPLDF